MELNEEILNKIIEEISVFNEIKLIDIPCVDLYMDQVTTFFDDKLEHLKREEKEKILTKTMINNYAKAKILMPVKSKKYSKDHIILLILIYNLKQILSINDIKLLFTPILEKISDMEKNNVFLDDIYSSFSEIKKNELHNFNENFEEKFNLIKEKVSSYAGKDENKELIEMFLMVISLINSANTQRRMAEKIIDNFFNEK